MSLTGMSARYPERAVRRSAPAGGRGPRADQPPEAVAAGRAAGRARRQAQGEDAARADHAAEGSRHRLRLRDARPAGGAGAGASHRGDEPRAGSSSWTSRPRSTAFPKNRFVADFIGTCNILDAEVLRVECGTHAPAHRWARRSGGARRPTAPTAGDKGVLALRPEQVAIGPQLAARPGREPLRRQSVRLPLSRRRDRLRGGTAQRQPRGSHAAELGAWPRQVLRGRRSRSRSAGASTPAGS